jgi:TolB-like protein
LIYNKEYLDRIEELSKVAKNTTQAMSSPIMRFMQIEEKLKTKFIK